MAKVDFGGGVIAEAIVAVDRLRAGDYVLVHAGMIISKVRKRELLKSFSLIRELSPSEYVEELDRIIRDRLREVSGR